MSNSDAGSGECAGTVNLVPSPRVLRMLGNIEFENWQSLAELIDNSIDALLSIGSGNIFIKTPSRSEFDSSPQAEIRVIDDGPGMSANHLENALKAGYSGNDTDPLSHLGLFGMGFNIATARLGNVTKVKTTKAGDDYWTTVTIDFKEMERNNSYVRPLILEKKTNREIHGTEVIITNLSERVRTIRQQTSLKRELSRIYAPILGRGIINIYVDEDKLVSRGHCTWGADRYVTRDNERIYAKHEIDVDFGTDYFCSNCWEWIDDVPVVQGIDAIVCPKCGDSSSIVQKKRRLTGWIGVQRYYDQDHYGIDLIRNGRVIEPLCKDLFYWYNPETGEREKEYPVEAFHWGGRIVGELNIDFVPVTYMKDHFEKVDKRWKEVERYIRGDGPFRPKIAKEHGYPENTSPLGRMYKGYRKGNEAGKGDLLPGTEDGHGTNTAPKNWADKFYEGDPEYQTDHKWWELVELAELAKRTSGGGTATLFKPTDTNPEQKLNENQKRLVSDTGCDDNEEGSADKENTTDERTLEKDPLLSQDYSLDELQEPPINVVVNRVISDNSGKSPLKLHVLSKDKYEVVYNPTHPVFNAFNLEPLDLVLIELSQSLSRRKDDPNEWPPSRIFCMLKDKYSADRKISPAALTEKAQEMLQSMRKHIADKNIPVSKEDINHETIDEVRRNVLSRLGGGEEVVNDLLETTKYVNYASDGEMRQIFLKMPEHFLDGTYWNRPYRSLGTAVLQEETKRTFAGYISDIVWLKREGSDYDPDSMPNDIGYKLQRASYSLKLLEAYRE